MICVFIKLFYTTDVFPIKQGVNSSSTAYKESDQIGFSGLLAIKIVGNPRVTWGTL